MGRFYFMAKDPAFLFYPGDYLRDTQCLSEKVQVAYDRLMCEHMRNICISEHQLNFFTKKLTKDEKDELLMVLTKIEGGFQIDWVYESIVKRKAYSESRSKNRTNKPKNISKTYVNHMEDEIENVNEDKNRIEIQMPFNSLDFKNCWIQWKEYKNKEHKFKYKTPQSEQAGLIQLSKMANGNELDAIKIITQSMANGWKGFFELKNNNNGKTKPTIDLRSAVQAEFDKRYGGGE